MSDPYTTRSTSKNTASVDERVLSVTGTTRRLLRPELVDNPKRPEAAVRITIVHQRKGPHDEWEDIATEPLSTLKAREQAKFALSTEDTLRLYEELQALFKIFEETGILPGKKTMLVGVDAEYLRVPPQRKQVIQQLLDQEYSEEVWGQLVETQPDLATKLSLARLHQERAEALARFRGSLKEQQPESYWQRFFEANTWIFGYGLRYQFLHTVQAQPHYGGTAYTGSGGEKGDYLAATSGDTRFTVLVEIKKPDTQLLQTEEYRNGVFAPSKELAGAVAQLQVNCRKWEESSRLEQNAEPLHDENIFTVSPRGILVIGCTELSARDHRISFELFRRNLTNPEVITFDELYNRARYIVEHTSPVSHVGEVEGSGEDTANWSFDDEMPF